MKLFNEYNYGSYLLYKGVPVFIDSRADLYAPEFNGNVQKTENTTVEIYSQISSKHQVWRDIMKILLKI